MKFYLVPTPPFSIIYRSKNLFISKILFSSHRSLLVCQRLLAACWGSVLSKCFSRPRRYGEDHHQINILCWWQFSRGQWWWWWWLWWWSWSWSCDYLSEKPPDHDGVKADDESEGEEVAEYKETHLRLIFSHFHTISLKGYCKDYCCTW